MWKPEHRRAADRHGLRYPSDLSDSEWALIEPAIPPAKRGGRRREVNVREVLNAIFYVLSTGCQWQALPKDLPPKSTAHSYFMLWDWDGTLERLHHALYVETREREGREASPTAAIIDSQSAKGAQKGAPRLTRKGLMRADSSSFNSYNFEQQASIVADYWYVSNGKSPQYNTGSRKSLRDYQPFMTQVRSSGPPADQSYNVKYANRPDSRPL
jgi:transposase